MTRIVQQNLRKASTQTKKSSDTVNDFLWNFGSWLNEEDEYSDIIISSRIRLARNVKGYPFPHKASPADLTKIIKKVKDACTKCKTLHKANYFEVEGLSNWDCKYFVERRLASPQFVENEIPALLVVGRGESISIMVNEEDHMRIQCIEAGLKIEAAWRKVSSLDDELEENLNYSFSNKYGYLTACPTNLGTGMRVSIFVHLPGLCMREEIENVLKNLPSSEIAVRGFYGEGSESVGCIFQISNQLTLGRAENNMLERMNSVAKELVALEREARTKEFTDNRTKVEDTVLRAFGVLKNARIITSLEAMNLLATLRLGIEVGLVKNISRLAINQLMVLVQPAHLQKIYNKKLSADERDVVRAEFIRENLEA